MSGTILSLLMLAGIALGIGGVYLIAKKREYKQGWLMITAAVVMFFNVLVWTAPIG
ncbi:MAG: hypothetical protein J0G94_01120 [Sphingomonadales bacterium]|nr:hypothetical protein [Sphingomonadales bacterium]